MKGWRQEINGLSKMKNLSFSPEKAPQKRRFFEKRRFSA